MGVRARKRQDAAGAKDSRILAAVQQFAADHLEYRIEAEAGSSLSTVEVELNRMAEKLGGRREEVVRAVELYCLHRFGSVLVHDLRNLASRLHFVPANLRSSPDDTEVIEACATTIEDTVQRLQRLVARFRDQREAMVLKQDADLNRVVQGALEHSGASAAADIHVDLSLEELPSIHMDPPYLEEALVNILRNAIEAMNGKGRLTVTTRNGEGPNGVPSVVVDVSDNGPGMTSEFMERELFAPFRSTKERGLGLGMFSCRETVELHGGRVEVDSVLGKGTRFSIFLPLQLQEKPGP